MKGVGWNEAQRAILPGLTKIGRRQLRSFGEICAVFFFGAYAHGCSSGAKNMQPSPLPKPSDVKIEMGVPQHFFANTNWAFDEPRLLFK
jgi:hypothetical protein